MCSADISCASSSLAVVSYKCMTYRHRTVFVPGLAAEPMVTNACALCIPISGPLFVSSLWLVISLSLVLLALISGVLDSVSLGVALA